jgi:serine/threonine protein kinase
VLCCVEYLHSRNIIHGDLKPRNIVRMSVANTKEPQYMLIDLDASAVFGQQVSLKYSSAYSPPEMAPYIISQFLKEGKLELLPVAEPSFDIWGFGVILYELCSGIPLFPEKDVSDDNLIQKTSLMHLANWLCLDEERIRGVLSLDRNVPQEIRGYASHLISWCLQRNPRDRPTIAELKAHPFFRNHRNIFDKSPLPSASSSSSSSASSSSSSSSAPLSNDGIVSSPSNLEDLSVLKAKYHFYFSHLQEVADVVNSLNLYFKEYCCDVCVNGFFSETTLRDIERSEVFVFFLTANVLYHPSSLYELFQVLPSPTFFIL